MSRNPSRVGPFRNPADPAERAEPHTAVDDCDRVDVWRDLLREHFVALDVAGPADAAAPFPSTVRSTLLGTLSVAEVTSVAQSCVRTPRLVHDDADRYLQVGLLARGHAVVEQDGRAAEVEPGRFVVYETERPFAWHFREPWKLLVLTWPRHLVDLDADLSRSATARVLGEGRLGGIVGRVLADAVLAPPGVADDGARLADELCALVGTTLGDHRQDDEPLSAAGAAELRRRAAAYIAEHLEEPALDVEEVAHAHYVSVRSLHRAFAGADLTVGSLLRRLRLAHARQRLLEPHDAHLSVTEIACACGFADLPTFSHGFKREYGESPSSYRRRGRAAP